MERQPHISEDLRSRRLKALKIERLLELGARQQPMRLLEVGTGSGGIAHYFGTHPSLRIEVDAVDVRDNRVALDGYRFRMVTDTALPYPDASFDVVISNHVIEHVGDSAAQQFHLAELRRVLATDGVGYLAVPNRWMVVEPHYRIPFLSWLPRRWRTRYLRLLRRGSFYDCEPLEVAELETMLRTTHLQFENLCVPAVRTTIALERQARLVVAVLDYLPDKVLSAFSRLIPTLIYRFWHDGDPAVRHHE